jgi:hypothetical protein
LHKESPSIDEIRQCLDRSGYFLESRLVHSLTQRNYFVEPNQVVRDPRTGKSREIDLIAERYRYSKEYPNASVITHFVIEAVNNKYAFILTTERPSSPGADFEGYVQFACTPNPNPFLKEIDIYEEKGPRCGSHWKNVFAQYCVLSKNNNASELMASHPDDVYGSLLKPSEYVDGAKSRFESRELNDDYWRLWFWHLMLVLNGQLVTVRMGGDDTPKLEESDTGLLDLIGMQEKSERLR